MSSRRKLGLGEKGPKIGRSAKPKMWLFIWFKTEFYAVSGLFFFIYLSDSCYGFTSFQMVFRMLYNYRLQTVSHCVVESARSGTVL